MRQVAFFLLVASSLSLSPRPDASRYTATGDPAVSPREHRDAEPKVRIDTGSHFVRQIPDCSEDKAAYCPLVDAEGRANTMCQFCGVDAEACGPVSSRTLTEEEVRLVVDTHNALRRRVAKGLETRGAGGRQPRATDMYELRWDQRLADSAQRWTDQCREGHDDNRLSPDFASVGQNVAHFWSSSFSSQKNLEESLENWYIEVVHWPADRTGNFSLDGLFEVVGHYTQLVWGATRKVGCGFIANVDKGASGIPFRQTVVCNYGPGGNVLGDRVYSTTWTDPPGSACPRGSDDGLCIH